MHENLPHHGNTRAVSQQGPKSDGLMQEKHQEGWAGENGRAHRVPWPHSPAYRFGKFTHYVHV